MDNYSLEEVKMLISENKITPEVFKNILKSASRRLELYNDSDDLEILKFLSQNKVVPDKIKKEINSYLAIYDKVNNKNNEVVKSNTNRRRATVITILVVAIILIAICILLIMYKR